MATIIVKEERELEHVAETFLGMLKMQDRASIIALTGDLGAGKTALTKAIARVLGVSEHVTSPTFVIMKSYPIPHHERFSTLTHIDAYRIDDEKELTVLGFEELLVDPKRLLVIEWPERVKTLMPETAHMIRIDIGKENERIISYGD